MSVLNFKVSPYFKVLRCVHLRGIAAVIISCPGISDNIISPTCLSLFQQNINYILYTVELS